MLYFVIGIRRLLWNLLWGESISNWWNSLHIRPVIQSFDFFSAVSMHRLLKKQSCLEVIWASWHSCDFIVLENYGRSHNSPFQFVDAYVYRKTTISRKTKPDVSPSPGAACRWDWHKPAVSLWRQPSWAECHSMGQTHWYESFASALCRWPNPGKGLGEVGGVAWRHCSENRELSWCRLRCRW